jgi:5-methyltetrahydropteroyltriglutamate--homocysteine methyltransferase
LFLTLESSQAVPERYTSQKLDALDEYFAMGRGHQKGGVDVPALEMVKWFDSNYHYVKPTLQDGQTFSLASDPKPVREFVEAKEAGFVTRPVLVGPVSFLALGKADRGSSVDPISLIDKLVPVYVELLKALKDAGAESVQIDEPILVFDLSPEVKSAFKSAYEVIGSLGGAAPSIVLATYFGDIVHNFDVLPAFANLHGLHVDLVRNPEQLEPVIKQLGPSQILCECIPQLPAMPINLQTNILSAAGVVDGRNIWKNDFQKSLALIKTAIDALGEDRVIVATSSSLLHTPHTLVSEKKLPAEVYGWFSFAVEKCRELAVLAKAVSDPASVKEELDFNAASMKSRAESARTNDPKVKERQAAVTAEMHNRKSTFETRLAAQKTHLKLPLFPTTTIGSFPQTQEIRVQRNKFTKGDITEEQYDDFIKKEIDLAVQIQDELDLGKLYPIYLHFKLSVPPLLISLISRCLCPR